MKIVNSIIIATVVGTLAISVFTFQPTAAEASYNAVPSPTPRRKVAPKRVVQIGSDGGVFRKSVKRPGLRTASKPYIGGDGFGSDVHPATKSNTAQRKVRKVRRVRKGR